MSSSIKWFALLFICGTAHAGESVLTWTPPTLNEDGTPLTDLASYEIWHGCSQSGVYDTVDVVFAPATTYTVTGLSGTCYFAAKATNSQGVSSGFSNEAIKVVSVLAVPGAITDTQITWKESQEPNMGVTYIAGAQTGSDSSSSLVLTHGLTFTADDHIIAMVYMNNDGRTVTSTGFTLMANSTSQGSGGASWAILTKVATGSEPSSYTFSISSSNRVSVLLAQIRGSASMEDDITPVTDGQESGSNSIEGPTITTAVNSMAFTWGLQDTNSAQAYSSVDNSYTLGETKTSNQSQGFAYRAFDSGGATGVTKITKDGTATHQGYSFSFKESAGGGASLSIPVAMHQYARLRNN